MTSNFPKNHVYSAQDVVLQAIGCHQLNEESLSSLTAEEMYLCALRDGFLTLGLKAGSTWAYTPRCSLREQPSHLLMALLNGATTLYITEKTLQTQPQLLESETIDVIGVSNFLKSLWLEHKGFPRQKIRCWYQYLCDSHDERSWEKFIEKHKLEKIPVCRFFIDNSQGGILFASLPALGKANIGVWPALGVPWDLLQPNQLQQRATLPFGVFQQNSATSNLILGELHNGWIVASTVHPNKEGYTLPISAIESSVSALDFVESAVLLTMPIANASLTCQMVLIVFVSPTHAKIGRAHV